MNPHLGQLQPYPFEKLAQLKQGIAVPQGKGHIALSIGEPQHATPHFIAAALITHAHGLAKYPSTKGLPEFRQSIADWLTARFTLPMGSVDAERHVLPVSGTREALFAFAQCVVDSTAKPLVLMPNPFYQIYEGAALLAGAEPYFLNTTRDNGYLPDFDAVPAAVWNCCQLLYVCSPGNPTGAVLPLAQYQKLIELAERYDFVIASDECYSELYNTSPPPGLLQAAAAMGNSAFRRCVAFHSLSKRSNAPGLRSGFVAGDAAILKQFLLYRTYHGCAMPVQVQQASALAWRDEQHVRENRVLYREKFTAVHALLADVLNVSLPPAGFYLWPQTPGDDAGFAQCLYATENLTVLPGSYLSRDAHGLNPGAGHVRLALVAPLDECVEAAQRIRRFVQAYYGG